MPAKKSELWVLAMDSARARILCGLGGNDDIEPTERVMRAEVLTLRNIMADKLGRSFSSKGGGRHSAMEHGSDPHAKDQRGFICQITTLLECHRRAGDFETRAVCTKPDVLELLRQLMSPILKNMIVKEGPKTLRHFSPHALPRVIGREINNDRFVP